jgi:hypothetical protein
MSAPAEVDPFIKSVEERLPYYQKRIKLFEQYQSVQNAKTEEGEEGAAAH